MEPEQRREHLIGLAYVHGVICVKWVLEWLYVEAGLTIHSAEKDFQTLVSDGLFRRDGSGYYLPTEKLCAHYGRHRSFGRMGGVVSVARRVGVAAYALRYGLTRYTAEQFRKEFPDLAPETGACGHYVINYSTQPHSISWVEVDCNTRGDTRRTVKRCFHLLRVRQKIPAFVQLIKAGQFQIVIVTPSAGKKLRLERAFAKSKRKIQHIEIEVIEELQDILLGE